MTVGGCDGPVVFRPLERTTPAPWGSLSQGGPSRGSVVVARPSMEALKGWLIVVMLRVEEDIKLDAATMVVTEWCP